MRRQAGAVQSLHYGSDDVVLARVKSEAEQQARRRLATEADAERRRRDAAENP